MNAGAFSAINRVETSCCVGPINPPAILWHQALSRFARVADSRFFFFSKRRLEAIAGEVHSKCQADARLDFFAWIYAMA
jgi:hypothetical protein